MGKSWGRFDEGKRIRIRNEEGLSPSALAVNAYRLNKVVILILARQAPSLASMVDGTGLEPLSDPFSTRIKKISWWNYKYKSQQTSGLKKTQTWITNIHYHRIVYCRPGTRWFKNHTLTGECSSSSSPEPDIFWMYCSMLKYLCWQDTSWTVSEPDSWRQQETWWRCIIV